MSNFQRTRSKVWWDSEDDYPTSYHTPKTEHPQTNSQKSNVSNHSSPKDNLNSSKLQNHQMLEKYFAENQKVGEVPNYYEEEANNEISNKIPESPNKQCQNLSANNGEDAKSNLDDFKIRSPQNGSPMPYLRMLRPASPASHRSQDSGFSDSDCSPPQAAPKAPKREESWQRVIESLKASRSADAICTSQVNVIETHQKAFTPDLQKIQLTPLKNFMQAHQEDKKVEPKTNISEDGNMDKAKQLENEVNNVKRRPKLLSVRSCPDGRTNSVHRLIYKFDHGESPLPGYKPAGAAFTRNQENLRTSSRVATLKSEEIVAQVAEQPAVNKSNNQSPEVYRNTPKSISRKIDYIDYSQMCCAAPTASDEVAYEGDLSKSMSPDGFIDQLEELNFSNVSPASMELPKDHETSLNLTNSPLYRIKFLDETNNKNMIQENEANLLKSSSSKKRTDTFSQGATDDTYFYKKRQGAANKSLPNSKIGQNSAKYKINLTISPGKLANTSNIVAKSDANNVTTVSVNSFNSIDDYDILYSKKTEPNNNSVEVSTPKNICQITCTGTSKFQETEIANVAFSTPVNGQRYNNETYELELPTSAKPYAAGQQNYDAELEVPDNLELNPSCTSTPKWYKPSELRQVTPVSHKKVAVHRRVNLLAGFNAAPEEGDKDNSSNNDNEDKLGIKIVDDKVWMKSKSTNCETEHKRNNSSTTNDMNITSKSLNRADSKDILEENRLADITQKNNCETNKNIFVKTSTQKIKKDKNIFGKIFGKKTTPSSTIKNNTTMLEDNNLELKSCSSSNEDTKKLQEINKSKQKSLRRPECVMSWLNELSNTCESEAMIALQNKAIRGSLKKTESTAKNVDSVVHNMNAVRKIAEQAAGVLDELEHVQRSICENKPELSGPLLQSALGGVTAFVKSNETTTSSCILIELCDAAKVGGRQVDLATLAKIASGVRLQVEELSFRYLEALSEVLEDPPSTQCLSAALSGLGALCSAYGGAIGYSAVKAGLIRALLIVCVNSHTYTLRQNISNEENQLSPPSSSLGKALRVLATLCQTEQSIRQFCQAGGVSVIQDILEDKRCAEPERREACAVLTQITGPWVTDDPELNQKNHKNSNQDWRQELNKHKTPLIRALTDLLSETKCCQTLLLCAAALANSSLPRMTAFIDKQLEQFTSPNGGAATECLAWCEAVTELLNAVKKRGPGCSVFLQEQTSSLLCNLSSIQECRRRFCPSSKNPTVSSEPIMALFSFINTCRRLIAPEDLSFRRGNMRTSERMESASLLQNSIRDKVPDHARSSTKSEKLPRNSGSRASANFDATRNTPQTTSLRSPDATPKISPAEKASAERMLITAALCLTRFCKDRETARFCYKSEAHRYLLVAADLLKKQQTNVKVLEVCEETAKMISAFGNDSTLAVVNESFV